MFRIKKRELGVGVGGKVWKRVKGVKSECDGGKGERGGAGSPIRVGLSRGGGL